MTNLQRVRAQKFENQDGLCWYCGMPMSTSDPAKFARRHGITNAQAEQLKCTAEHLVAKCDGGTDDLDNIVAACRHCNQSRHRPALALPAKEFRKMVQDRKAQGRWQTATWFKPAEVNQRGSSARILV